jgi:isoleucyl-tRNA synthetase
MNDSPKAGAAKTDKSGPDYSASLYLPQTDFPMRAGLPKKEPEILARWEKNDLYRQLRAAGQGKRKFILHDGPPYANGNIHIGHALNKILKDLVTRSQQMLDKDSNYVPGWDCHGLPIEWKIEEENYRSKGKPKPDFAHPDAMIAFRRECRAYADHWVKVQGEEFRRLGVTGDWKNPYLTMTYPAEAQIAREIMKFAANGLLYRGSKPVMWSVVEKTALAEAEVEYEDHTSDTILVKFPIAGGLEGIGPASVVIWTTTPWTIPGNRAISFSSKIAYGAYRVEAAPEGNWAAVGDVYILADKLAEEVMKQGKVERYARIGDASAEFLSHVYCKHPLYRLFPGQDSEGNFVPGYDFDVPLLDGEHVTDETGTGFVHTAPSHGREDFDIWMASTRLLHDRGVKTAIPTPVDADGFYTDDAPGFAGARVITDKGEKGDANDRVMKALVEAGALVARGRLKHQYPHSWRSKKPVIFRNTPQWFIAMDEAVGAASPKAEGRTLRDLALSAIKATQWVPTAGENRINGMIANRPDWVVSRQRAWGVPIAVFVKKGSHDILLDETVNARIAEAFEKEGADAWFAADAAARFLKPEHDPADYDKVDDVLDVWFDSGSTHAFVLEDTKHFPTLAGIHPLRDGGPDEVMYLEGSDQHRGWFHSSLLESCGTRGRAPYDAVLTHGFTLDEHGRKMSKSLGNVTVPQKIIAEHGADILRLWVGSVDYSDDQRIGPEIIKSITDNYRKLRNTIRWMLGSLAHFNESERVALADMPELERLMLHRLAELDGHVRAAYAAYEYNRVVTALTSFMTGDLSAFYFDIRKDALYCDAPSSLTRRAALTVIDEIFRRVVTWLAPVLAFTCEEAWLARYPSEDGTVHTEVFPVTPADWRDEALAAKWKTIRNLRRVVTGALEIERAEKRIGSSLEAAPVLHIADEATRKLAESVDFAEICIASGLTIAGGEGPAAAFRLPDVAGVAIVPQRAEGRKCARSWKISPLVGSDAEFPDVSPRDAQALRELKAMGKWPV